MVGCIFFMLEYVSKPCPLFSHLRTGGILYSIIALFNICTKENTCVGMTQTKNIKSNVIFGKYQVVLNVEGPERELQELRLAFVFFRGWEMGINSLGLGFMIKKTIEKWERD